MESTEESKYEVIITNPAEVSFYEILDYLYDNYPIDSAEKIATELRDTAQHLHYKPERGTTERQLTHRKKKYRYILFHRTLRADIKIIYFIDQGANIVYITDFFPTAMDDQQLPKRNE